MWIRTLRRFAWCDLIFGSLFVVLLAYHFGSTLDEVQFDFVAFIIVLSAGLVINFTIVAVLMIFLDMATNNINSTRDISEMKELFEAQQNIKRCVWCRQTYGNDLSECPYCGFLLDLSGIPPEKWECHKCGEINISGMTKCHECNEKRKEA
jgi:predicted RNA-binding Zn-ribbon protein involved in translation (DUF1610 family)